MAKKEIIKKENKENCCNHKWHHKNMGCGGGYFLGMIGAAVYFISTTSGFWNIILAILKAIVWPAFVVYGLLKYLGL